MIALLYFPNFVKSVHCQLGTYQDKRYLVLHGNKRRILTSGYRCYYITPRIQVITQSQEDISGLFKPFHRSIHTENHPKGLGLGLSIVRHIVELHKGSITVSSEIDKGTEFRVLLPAYIQPEEVS